jgi:hypothetical protein
MSFVRVFGRAKIEYMPKAASTVFPNGALVYANGSGALIPADATSGDHFGVIQRAVTASDSDYATTAKVMIDVCSPEDVFEADVKTGTLTPSMVGNRYDLHADGDGIDVTASAKSVVTVVGFVSATKALVKVNAMAAHLRVATT